MISLKEKFIIVYGVLNGEYIKYDESGKFTTTIYHDGRIVSLDEKIRIQNQEKVNSLNEYKKNIYKLIEIDNVEMLANELIWSFENPELRNEAIIRNRKFVEENANYDINMKVISEKYHELLNLHDI